MSTDIENTLQVVKIKKNVLAVKDADSESDDEEEKDSDVDSEHNNESSAGEGDEEEYADGEAKVPSSGDGKKNMGEKHKPTTPVAIHTNEAKR